MMFDGLSTKMSRSRFAELAATFGGDISRWPRKDRIAARWFSLRHPYFAGRLLAPAEQLDRVLSCAVVADPSAELTSRIIDSAARVLPREKATRRWTPVWIGAGLAAACASGVLSAFIVMPEPTSPVQRVLAADPADEAAAALREPIDLGEV